jgi:hypothetical protein
MLADSPLEFVRSSLIFLSVFNFNSSDHDAVAGLGFLSPLAPEHVIKNRPDHLFRCARLLRFEKGAKDCLTV